MSDPESTPDIADNDERPADEEKEAEELGAEMEASRNVSIQVDQISRSASELSSEASRIVGVSESMATQAALARRVPNPMEVLEGKLLERLDQLEATLKAEIAGREADRDARNWTRAKWLFAGGLTVLALTSDVMQVISFLAPDVGPSFVALKAAPVSGGAVPPTQVKDVPLPNPKDAMLKWIQQDEVSFWKDQATYYAPGTTYSVEAQLVNAQTAMFLCRNQPQLCPIIRWKRSEKLDVIDGLKHTYLTKGSGAMYLSVPTYQHNGQPLNRMAALDCVSIALASLRADLRAASSGGKLSMTPVGLDGFVQRPLGDKAAAPLDLDRPARHFEPVFVFEKAIADGLDLHNYARDITNAWNVKAKVNQKVEPTAGLYTEATEQQRSSTASNPIKLRLKSSDDVLAQVSDEHTRTKLQKLRDQFLDTCAATYPLLPGETVASHSIAYLEARYLSAMPGSLVYLRSTSLAQMSFITDQVKFDLIGGKPKLVYRPPRPINLLRKPLGVFATAQASLDTEDIFTKIVGPVAQTLAFSLPAPYGIFLAGGIQLLDEVFGIFGQKGPALVDVIKQLLDQTLKAIQQMLDVQEIQKATDNIKTFLSWLNREATNLNSLNSSSDLYIKTSLLDVLEDASNPSFPNLANDLTSLNGDHLCTIYNDEVIDLAFLAASCLLLAYRMRCQLWAVRASFALGRGDLANYDQYTGEFRHITIDYEEALADWSDSLAKRIDKLRSDRVALVGPVHYYDNRNTECHSSGGPAGSTHCDHSGDDGYAFDDDFLQSNGKPVYARANNRWSSGCCNQNDHCEVFQGDVDGHRDSYLKDLNDKLTERYKKNLDTLTEWKAGLTAIKAMMPPDQPSSPPVITAWSEVKPSDDLLDFQQVQYLVEYANGKGPSPISQGSGFQSIRIGKAPVISVPVDPTNTATKRNVYRQLAKKGLTPEARAMVDIIPDNTTTTWSDIPRD